jgi:hypothetical protein
MQERKRNNPLPSDPHPERHHHPRKQTKENTNQQEKEKGYI